jgi:hypothetical protein
MPKITLYNFKTKQRTLIPLEELAPGWIQINLRNDTGEDETVWVNQAELKLGVIRHPPFDEDRRRVIRDIQLAFREVDPSSPEKWELDFRCDADPDAEIALWRWMAYSYKRLTRAGLFNLTRKRDLRQLLLAWVSTRNIQAVLATAPLAEMRKPEARKLLEMFRTTPLEFFGGATLRLAQMAQWNPRQLHAHHYLSVQGPDEFRLLVGQARIIVAIDYASGDVQVLFGCEHLPSLEMTPGGQAEAQPQHLLDAASGSGGFTTSGWQADPVFFALNFDRQVRGADGTTEFGHICATVCALKGTFWVDFEQQTPS